MTSRLSKYVPAAAIAVVAGVAGWVATASLQQDFAAYWVAGAARRAGFDPYVNHVGGAAASGPGLWDGVAVFTHSRFLYAPIVAELFRAFAALPYPAAKAIFTALMVGAWIAASLGMARAAGDERERGLAVAFGAGALFYPLHLALERGQIDPLVLLLLVVAFAARARAATAGAALAAAAAFKPALAGIVPVLAALGRWRAAVAAVAGLAVVALASAAVSGPALAREYATHVLPRAALYGDGGNEEMLLPPERLVAHLEELEAGVADVGGRTWQLAAFGGRASASLPRLLAPDGPTRFSARAPAVALLAALTLAAFVARRRARHATSEAGLLWAAAVVCVVASPAGWVMGLVVALPLAPWLAAARPGVPRVALGLALVACACPPPLAGWSALAGTAVVAAATALALTRAEARSPGGPSA